jgi:hypothetical protein
MPTVVIGIQALRVLTNDRPPVNVDTAHRLRPDREPSAAWHPACPGHL